MTRFRPFLALIAIFAALVLVAGDVDARPSGGKSFGSRGSRTFAPPAATNTAPTAAPMQRTTTQPGAATTTARPNAAAAAPAAGGMFGGMRGVMGGLAAGFLGAGLLGMLFGGGFMSGLAGFASMLGMLIQIGLVVVVAMLAWNWWKRRQAGGAAPATASGPAFDRVMNRDNASASPYQGSAYTPSTPSTGFGGTAGGSALGGSALGGMGLGRMGASAPQEEAPIVIGEANLTGEDFDAFERLLSETSQAYGREDLGALRTRVTPEMLSYMSEELSDMASNGISNEVSDIKLLQGDLSEAWTENDTQYATVAMRYAITDAKVERATGKVVDGSREPTEVTEFWTFRRAPAGQWVVSGIQQTEEA